MCIRLVRAAALALSSVLFLGTFLGVTSAHAVEISAYEIRSPLGVTLVKPSDLNSSQPGTLQIGFANNFGADALVDIESYGVGLRFDSISATREDGAFKYGDKIEVASRVFSLVARKRWAIDDWRYLAAIGTVGVYNPSVVNRRAVGVPWVQYTSKDTKAFSVGAEGGWTWDPFLVALEAGYQYLVMKSLETDKGTPLLNGAGAPVNVDFSGPYLKVILGLRF